MKIKQKNKLTKRKMSDNVKYTLICIILISMMMIIGGCESSPTKSNGVVNGDKIANITMTTTNQSVRFEIRPIDDIKICWGDGNEDTIERNQRIVEIRHDFESEGTHTITIKGYVSYLNSSDNGISQLRTSNQRHLSIIKCRSNDLSVNALNDLFRTLHNTQITNHLFIGGNPGTTESDSALAEERGWTVFRENFGEGVITIISNPDHFHFTIVDNGLYIAGFGDIEVDWGDGNVQHHVFPLDSESPLVFFQNRYEIVGTHKITIRGNVTRLNIRRTTARSIDVSQNPFLRELTARTTNLPNDSSISRLESLDVSKNPLLEEITMVTEGLLYLNVSNNPMMHTLIVPFNKIEDLDIKNSPVLTMVNIHSNNLINLVINNNPKLTYLNVESNQLTDLDVSNLELLEILDAVNNQLKAIDVSNNKSLRSLGLSRNNISTLDVSNNKSLSGLGLSHNNITTLDLNFNRSLNYLSVNNNNFSAAALDDLFHTLHDEPFEKSININNNPGTYASDKSIADDKGWRFRQW